MNSSTPYLLPALLEWIVDNGCTPHLVINTGHPEVRVPDGHSSDGQIVLNVSTSAVADFELNREYVFFRTRFAGVPREIYAPMGAILGIYARESGEGMAFSPADGNAAAQKTRPKPVQVKAEPKPPPAEPPRPAEGRPKLRLVRDEEDDD